MKKIINKKFILSIGIAAVALILIAGGIFVGFENNIALAEGDGVSVVSLYKNMKSDGIRQKYGEKYVSEWVSGEDITSIEVIADDVAQISTNGRHYQDIWKEAWERFEGCDSCKICYRVTFTLTNGEKIDKMIMKPGDELSYREYLENYLYDDIRVSKSEWYSHLEPDEADDDSIIMSSVKCTAGEKIDQIASEITITACIYDGDEDFDENGYYIGGVSKSVQLVNKAKSLSISVKCNGNTQYDVRDGDYYSANSYSNGDQITISCDSKMAGIYILWDAPVSEWTLSCNGTEETHGTEGFLHEYVKLPTSSNECTIKIAKDSKICEIYAYSAGELPEDVQVWEPALEKADMLVFSTHADDEVLFFGGAITLYGGAQDYDVQVVYLCNYWDGDKVREHEKLNGLWTMGVTNYPLNMPFGDYYSTTLEGAKEDYDYDSVVKEIVSNIRRFKPQVIVSHDIDGEYGHGGHILLCAALRDALEMTANAEMQSESAEKYGTWDVPKTYLHLYEENQIKLNLREASENLDNQTPLEVAKAAYKKHESQQWCWFYVSDDYQYSCAEFGLYRTTVGNDTGNNMMENIVSYKEQARIAAEEAERLAAEEAERLAKEEAERLEKEEAERKAAEEAAAKEEGNDESSDNENADENSANNGKKSNKNVFLGVLFIAITIVLVIFVLIPSGLKLIRTFKK